MKILIVLVELTLLEPLEVSMEYMLFAGSCFYAAGGMNDFKGLFDSVESAITGKDAVRLDYGESPDWYQVVNCLSLEVVAWDGSAYSTDPKRYK